MRNDIFQNTVMFHDLLYFTVNSACSTHSYTYKNFFYYFTPEKKSMEITYVLPSKLQNVVLVKYSDAKW